MLSVPVRIDAHEWNRLYNSWLLTSVPSLPEWLKDTYNIVSYDWDQAKVYRLWFKDSESAVMFKLKF